MRIQVTYVADDGEEFYSEEECLEYEKRMNPDGSLLLFDGDFKLIKYTDPLAAFEKTEAIYVEDAEKAEKFLDWINDQTGYVIPEMIKAPAVYIYDDDTRSYYELYDRIHELERIKLRIIDGIKEAKDGREDRR